MNIRIVLTFLTLQAVLLFALGSVISQTKNCGDCQSSLSIPETLSFSASDGGKEDPEESRISLEATTASKQATDSLTTSSNYALKLQIITRNLLSTTTSPFVFTGSDRVNSSTRTPTKKPTTTKISLEDEHLVFIALTLIALILLSVALVLWLLIRKYSAENFRSLGV